jgi:hypothetical protein
MLVAFGATGASAQQCPRSGAKETASHVETLKGRLIYHDGIRQWFELKLDEPKCGKNSIQLTAPDDGWKSLQTFRGCRVRSLGQIDFSPTGYYSLDLYQYATRVKPIAACVRKPPLPDYSKAKPDPHVRFYTVHMYVDFGPGDHPIRFRVSSAGRELRPSQAYADYMLTGGYVLYGECGQGFAVDKVFGTPAARPSHFLERGESGDMATFDPESAAQSGDTNLRLGYTCIRTHSH